MSSYSSFWRVKCRRVLSCHNGRRKSGLKGRCLILTGGSRALRATVQQAICRGGGTDSLAQALSAQRRGKSPFFGALRAKKKVWTLSTLLASDWAVLPPNRLGFRMFPPLPSISKAWNPVRVPPRAQHTPSSEGVFALTCVQIWWSGPSDTGRGVCLAPRVACLVVGERVQGLGLLALRWL